MTNKTSMRLTFIASTGLYLYAVYKICLLTARTFDPLHLYSLTLGEKWWFLLTSSNSFLVMLALGLCGWLFVYAGTNKTQEIDHFVKIKKIVFSIYILFSIGSIFVVAYYIYSSLRTYQIYLNQSGYIANNLKPLLISMFSVVSGVFISVGGIMFGIYILSGNEKLRRVVLPIYLIGFISTMIIRMYNFVDTIISYMRIFVDFEQYGITMNQIYEIILSFAVSILLATASLIIILYGMKKKKIVLDEKLILSNFST